MKKYSCYERSLQVLTALIALTVAAVAIVAIIVNSNQNSLQRFCIISGNNTLIGEISLFTNEREVGWDLFYTSLPLVATSELQIRGPLVPGTGDTGPLALALCGVPSSLACDTSVAGVIKGKIDQTGAGGQPLKPIIQAIREGPSRFYVTDGTNRAWLNSLCGTP